MIDDVTESQMKEAGDLLEAVFQVPGRTATVTIKEIEIEVEL